MTRYLAALLGLAACAAGPPGTPAGLLQREWVAAAPPTAACHAATLVVTDRGTLLAAWFGGTAEGHADVGVWLARRDAGTETWSAPVEIAGGAVGDEHFPCWNPVLFQPRGGPLRLCYRVGPSPQRWWGVSRTSLDDGRTWSPPQRLPDGVLGPIKNKPVQLTSGELLAGSSTEDPARGWLVHVEHSTDGGATWTAGPSLADPERLEAIQPTLLPHPDGSLQLLCRTRRRELATAWSADGGRTWSPLQRTGLPAANSGIDAAVLPGGLYALVYNPVAPGSPDRGERDRCPLVVALSTDGRTWREALVLEDAPTVHGYAYPAAIVTPDGLLHVVYTCDRERIRHAVVAAAALRAAPAAVSCRCGPRRGS